MIVSESPLTCWWLGLDTSEPPASAGLIETSESPGRSTDGPACAQLRDVAPGSRRNHSPYDREGVRLPTDGR